MDEPTTLEEIKPDLMAAIRSRFQQGRKAAGFSLAEVAEPAGVSLQAIGQFELGKQELKLSAFLAACEALRLNVRWVLKGDGPMWEHGRPVPTKHKGRPADRKPPPATPVSA